MKSFRAIWSSRLPLGNAFLAALALAFAWPAAVVQGATVTVSTTVDVVDGNVTSVAALQATPGGAGISLREAVRAVNNDPGGPHIISIPAGTYTLGLAGADDTAVAGDLDILKRVTITGAGSASTIIRGGTTVANGVDKIFSCNPLGNLPGFPVSISGVTFRFGRNTDTNFAGGNNIGGAMDFDAGFGANFNGLGALTLDDVIFDQNSTLNGDGGALGLFDGGTVTVTDCQFTTNRANSNSTNVSLGGGIFAGFANGHAISYTFTSCLISGNATAGTVPSNGGGVFSFTGGLAFHACTIVSNSTAGASSDGGGIASQGPLTIDQGTIVSGNNAARWGGGIFVNGTTAAISNSTITSNTSGSSGGLGGGGIFTNAGTTTVSNCRIVGNSATGINATGGSQLGTNSGNAGVTMAAANNWFGTNAPPASFFGVGVTASPNLVLAVTAAPSTVVTGQTSTVTAAITKNTSNVSGFTVPNGTPVSYSAVLGTMSPVNDTLTSGTDTSTFTPTGVGAGSGAATVDSQTIAAPITINKANTITAIVSDAPDPSVLGQNYNVVATVAVVPPGGGTPTGTITVSDGTNVGTITLPATSVSLPSTSLGVKTITATYNGDANYIASIAPNAGHLVNKANTTTAIVSDAPDPSVFGQNYTVVATVAAAPPGSGTPTGTITVSDGVNVGTITLPATSVSLPSTSVGVKTITATYNGDTNFNGSNAPNAGHLVNKAGTTTAIVSDTPDPTIVGQNYTVVASLAVTAPGSGTPTGTITVSDGTNVGTITLPATSVLMPSTSPGAKTLTATYNGDTNFNADGSPGVAHIVNTPPTITGQQPVSTPEETARTIVFADLLVTDPNNPYPAGFTLTVMNGVNYTRVGNTITPALNFNGPLTVPLKVNDGLEDSNVFNLAVTVTAVNDNPVGVADAIERYPSQSVKVLVSTLLANDTDPDGDTPLTITSVGAAASGQATVTLSGTHVFYQPNAGFTAADTFTYSLSDGHGGTATGTVTVNLHADNAQSQNITKMEMLPDGSARVSFAGIPGRSYRVQSTDSLTPPNWVTRATVTADAQGKFQFTDPPPLSPTRFYRSISP